MVVEDEIRAKGLGVVLDGSIRDEEDADILNQAYETTHENLEERHYHARFEACRDGLWFSMVLNAILMAWIAWAAWRW